MKQAERWWWWWWWWWWYLIHVARVSNTPQTHLVINADQKEGLSAPHVTRLWKATTTLNDCKVFLFDFKILCYTWLSSCSKSIRQPVDLPHDLFPGLIHLKEHLGLRGQLPLDVWGVKNTFQVEPVSLAVQPLLLGEKHGRYSILTPNLKHSVTLKVIMW